MTIHHFVIHYIQKDQFRDPEVHTKDEEAKLLLPSLKLTNQGKLIKKFVESAATMFDKQRSGRVYADVGREDNTFADVLDRYLAGKTPFIKFSKRLATELAKTMKGTTLATGGYMAIAEYSASPRQLLIIMIRQEEGYAVDPDTLELRQAVHLDLSTINVGARINLEDYGNSVERHLSLVRGLKDVAKYFRRFLGVENFKSPKDETLDLANVMDAYFRENHENYDADRINEVRRDVAQLIKDSKGGQVPLLTIAGVVNPEDPEGFHDYANEHEISAEFTGDPETVKGWLRVRYKNKKLILDFDKNLLHDSIHWDEEEDELVIDVSKFSNLGEKLREAEQ
ncbi:nucleoid-associated protein [Luteolibacter ambystomatis]|uniref:Nucleoid-associated protein n=1 Tax=Luteolibacter ambystomatis TaxID=2824561 RepID=A0A975J1E3_9BACT|nr:nucleoid-associated protein [Luteolibacter ambystomatis]QUE52252.1 nucleoid-associated protein [Luteolibacter ambystomatis]